MPDTSFRDFVLDQLRGIAALDCRAMFGGHGLYSGRHFFGILHGGRLYLRTDAETVGRYLAEGMEPFRPNARQTLKRYYEVPVAVLEDADALTEWARESVEAQARAEAAGTR